MERKLTIREALETTERELKQISLPVELMESVGLKILSCAGNLRACLDAMARAEAEAEKEVPADEPDDPAE